jgi:hypothetical protein
MQMTLLRPVVQRSRNSTQPPVFPIKLIFYLKKINESVAVERTLAAD